MPYDDEIPPYVEPDRETDALAHAVIGAVIEVHRQIGGPGLDESLYQAALEIELATRAIPFAKQVDVPVFYKGVQVGTRRLDFVVGDRLVVEIKAVEKLAPVHSAQLLTYLRIRKLRVGLLVNEHMVKDGIKRIINPYL